MPAGVWTEDDIIQHAEHLRSIKNEAVMHATSRHTISSEITTAVRSVGRQGLPAAAAEPEILEPEVPRQAIEVPDGHVHDEFTGQVRRVDAQGPTMRLNDFGDDLTDCRDAARCGAAPNPPARPDPPRPLR